MVIKEGIIMQAINIPAKIVFGYKATTIDSEIKITRIILSLNLLRYFSSRNFSRSFLRERISKSIPMLRRNYFHVIPTIPGGLRGGQL